ncbi:putative bifunctional diguanylate cyclase/phosphodiesterase [Kangiella sediminilitoris]|uniref:Diguanylate cyclase/phosphodiesterase n=1 Tax=Kangiella sediminilitoris TaxID=1144748 RepID=A0A1B3B7T0_9GAMM|nr:bifunctional diguanylate cyclase/phosphodiesterase [Kangiella sediminilitoris]AOE48837.1 Diguanylate cyclase/phosphodiesterase [Kangiella sediminilitoris]
MEAPKIFGWIERHKATIQRYMIPTLLFLVGMVYLLVYVTGGIKYVYSHSMYIPILLAGLVFGIKGGIAIGLIAGIVLGPFMPMNVVTGEMQETANWLYRAFFFTAIGAISGAVCDLVANYLSHLRWLSRHRRSTRLPNRRALLDTLLDMSQIGEPKDSAVLAVIAIDNTLELKSAFGFGVIEHVTKQLARRLALNGGDDIFHTDSAQVTLILNKGDKENGRFLKKLGVLLQEPVSYNDISVHIEARTGYVAFDAIDKEPEVYLHRAEAALALVQERAQDMTAYSPEIVTKTEENLSILGELQTGIESGQLSLHYQPKIDFKTGKICSAEALLRWNHPVRGMIAPASFIPRAEQSTLIQTVTQFALKEAILQHLEWDKQGIRIPIAVNISTRNLLHPDFTDNVIKLLDEYNIDGDWIELEVTEGALMIDMEHTIDELIRLAGAKFSISIDDFGTGYSSLQYLHRLPASLIKIDQSFVKRLPNDKGAAYIVDAAVMLAKKMDIKTIAEGVESKEVYNYLKRLNCDMAQGHYIAGAMTDKEFSRWYLERNGIYASTA